MITKAKWKSKSKMENGNKMENVMEALFAMVWRYFITFQKDLIILSDRKQINNNGCIFFRRNTKVFDFTSDH